MNKPVLCAGEILFDFISTEKNNIFGNSVFFEKKAGGSPFNVSTGISRLGGKVDFFTKIGTDPFGEKLFEQVKENNIGTDFVLHGEGMNTTLVFVGVDGMGKPDFRFYRDTSGDSEITANEVEKVNPDDYSVFHTGSVALIEGKTAHSLETLFFRFIEKGIMTSIDPNVRAALIKDIKKYKNRIFSLISVADIVKMSDDDLAFFYGPDNPEECMKKLPVKKDSLVIITLGEKGSIFKKDFSTIHISSFPVNVKETVGCGDSFMASILFHLWRKSAKRISDISTEEIREMLIFASASSAIVASRTGASESMPAYEEVEDFIKAGI